MHACMRHARARACHAGLLGASVHAPTCCALARGVQRLHAWTHYESWHARCLQPCRERARLCLACARCVSQAYRGHGGRGHPLGICLCLSQCSWPPLVRSTCPSAVLACLLPVTHVLLLVLTITFCLLPGAFSMPIPGMAGSTPSSNQATRHARRVYVGGLPPTANEQSIATFFSHALSAIGGNTAGPGGWQPGGRTRPRNM